MSRIEFNDLVTEVLVSIKGMKKGSEEIIFTTASGKKFKMYHMQDCCERVSVEEVIGGPIEGLLNCPIMIAREDVSSGNSPDGDDSTTWTFYTLATVKATVVIRWLGESNGYYSERVDFEVLP